jgi:hypothetical protein
MAKKVIVRLSYVPPVLNPIVGNQTLEFGRLTLASAGDIGVVNTGDTIVSASIDSGTNANHWQVSSAGVFTPSATGVAAGLSASYALTCTFNSTTGTDQAIITINTEADTYSVSSNAEITAVLAISTATVAGKTIKLRPGTYTEITVSGKAYGSVVTFTSHDTADMAEVSGFTCTSTTNNVKISYLYLHDTATTTGGGIVALNGPVTGIEVSNNTIVGIVYAHGTDYSGTPYVGNSNGITSNSSGGAVSGISILDNYIHDVEEGITMGDVDGNVEISGNHIAYTYEDFIKVGRVDNFGTYTKVNDNVLHGGLALPTDSGNPHKDAIQFLGANLTADWTGIEVYRNIAWCEERGDAQLVFADDAPADIYFSGMKVKGNVMLSKLSGHGVYISRAKDCEIIGNTFAHQDTSGASNACAINVGPTQSSGVHKVWNNIAESFTIAGSPDLFHNITLGLNGATIAYTSVFDGATFNPQTRAEVLSKFDMKASGNADVDTSGDASRWDAGAVGSGYVTFSSVVPGDTGAALDATYEVSTLPIGALVLGQSELQYLFDTDTFYRQITQPTPGDGNLIVYTQDAVDEAPVRTLVNAATVAAGSVNPAMAALSSFLEFAAPGQQFIIGDASVAGTGRYQLVDDAESERKWTDVTSVIDAMEDELGAPVDVMIECWYNSDATSIESFKACFWPMYFGRTAANGVFTLGNTNPSAINTTAVFDHCFWDGAAATSALGRGVFTRDDTKWAIITPNPFLDAPISPAAELQFFSEDDDRLSEPARATMIALEADALATTVDLIVGPSAHVCRFGNGSSQIHPDVDTADGQILLMWPIAVNMLRQAGQTIDEPTIDSITPDPDGLFCDVLVNLPNGGTLTTLRTLRGSAAPGTPSPHYQDVMGFELEKGGTRHPIYNTSETSYSADYRGSLEITDTGSGVPRKGKVRITPTNPFEFGDSLSYLRGQATGVLLEDRDIDAQIYLDMLIEHIPALYDDTALYPFEGVAVRPYQEELDIGIAAPAFSPQSTRFDGTTSKLQSTSLSVAGSSQGTLSFWFYADVATWNTPAMTLWELRVGSTVAIRINTASSRRLTVSVVGVTNYTTPTNTFTVGTWNHVLVSYKTGVGGWYKISINDATPVNGASMLSATLTVAGTITRAYCSTTGGASQFWDGDIAYIYHNVVTALDITDVANRRKFIDAAGDPVDLGSDGSTPTGSAPAFFLDGGASMSNNGSGGTLTPTALTAGGVPTI